MSYILTLTKAERDAIDFVGDRYVHGFQLRELLWQGCLSRWPDGCEWYHHGEVTFTLPEHVAWQVCEMVEQGLDLFSEDFCSKLHNFCEKVV